MVAVTLELVRHDMSMPLSSASKRTQVLVTCCLTIPWTVICIVSWDLLPDAWRFQRWPALLRDSSEMACVVFWIADSLFAAWYFVALVADAYGDKSDGSA